MSDFKNDSTQAERRRVLTNDRQQRSSLLDHVEPEDGGRFAELARRDAGKPTVVGATPSVQYPVGPDWTSNAAVGVEPPLGVEIDALEPVGEAFEVERSLAKLAEAAAPTSAAASPGDVVETTSATLKRKKL